MSVSVRDIVEQVRSIAPFETAESYDNVGLLVGKSDRAVKRVLVALDVTMDVAREAIDLGAELIISHHPLLFRARKNLVEEDAEANILCLLVRNNISLLSAHTNLDKTEFSGSACCAKQLALTNIRPEGDYLFLGDLPKPMPASVLCERISGVLETETRCYGTGETMVSTLAIAGGAYDEGWSLAMAAGAQGLLTGEVRHHNALTATMNGFVLFDGGHYATEVPLVANLANYLQKSFDSVQYNVQFFASHCTPF